MKNAIAFSLVLVFTLFLTGCANATPEVLNSNQIFGGETGAIHSNSNINAVSDSSQEKDAFSSTDLSKNKFVPTLENLTYEILVTENKDLSITAVYHISIDGSAVQTITISPFYMYDWYLTYSGNMCNFLDANFDGFPDLFLQFNGADANAYYSIWLWDEATSLFVYNEDLSSIANPIVETNTKLIYSYSRDGAYPNHRVYTIDGKIAKLIAEISYAADSSNNIIATETLYESNTTTIIKNAADLNSIWDGISIELY